MAAGSVGNAILPVVAVSLAAVGTWRTSFAAFVPLFLLISVALWIVLPRRTAPEREGSASGRLGLPAGLRAGLTGGAIPLFVAIQCTMGLVYQGFIGFYPTYLIEVKGLSEGTAAALFGLFFAMSVVVQPLAGAALDRLGPRRALLLLLGTITASLLALPPVAGLGHLAALTVVLSTISGYGAITQTTIADTIPTAMKGTGMGILRSGWILFGSISPVTIGLLGDRGLLTEGFLALGGVAAVGLFLALFAPATR
jgi:predicted MFS family arabinose efflux permease